MGDCWDLFIRHPVGLDIWSRMLKDVDHLVAQVAAMNSTMLDMKGVQHCAG